MRIPICIGRRLRCPKDLPKPSPGFLAEFEHLVKGINGGDPLLLSNARLENLLFKLSRINHVERIRIGIRMPVTLPQRVTDSLVRDINHFQSPGKREIALVTHFEHPYEITLQAMEAVQKFRRSGMEVVNQLVYTFYNSRKFEAAALRLKLRLIGVTPYYYYTSF